MAAWRSRPAGDRLLSWRDWAVASVLVWLGPAPMALALLALTHLVSAGFGWSVSAQNTHPLSMLYILGYILLFAPVLSWTGLLVALGPVWWLLRKGAGGWASFAVLGLVTGAVVGGALQGAVSAAVFGLPAALVFRWILFRLRPAIFTAC